MENVLHNDLDHVLEHTEHLWAEVRGERFFITGGTGFVGTWLMESLTWANRRLGLGISAVVLTRTPGAYRQRLPHLAEDPCVTLHAGDAASFEYPEGSFPLVIHAATERYFPPSVDRPAATFSRDLSATERVLELARARRTRRFLFTSSGAVYGEQPAHLLHIPEDYAGAPLPTDTNSAYGQGKRASEFLCASYARVFGFNSAIARLFAFTGPYLPLDENYAAGNFIRDALAGGPVRLAGDGTAVRSYLYAADLAIWLWTILFRGKSGVAYNVGSAQAVSIAELARHVVDIAGRDIGIRIGSAVPPGLPRSRYIPSVERAQSELGVQVWVPLEEGLRRMWHWNRAQGPAALAIAEKGAAELIGTARTS
ncbi:MAG: NAD-dependent epimerase/dehydratase family protein [Bryobacteraceae bacterium]